MLRSTTDKNCLYLTADLRTSDVLKLSQRERVTATLFKTEMKTFPPIEDVLASVDRVASRVFAA
jgi:hypothetical protein